MPDKPLQPADILAKLRDMVACGHDPGSEVTLALTVATNAAMTLLGDRAEHQKQFDAPTVPHTRKPWRLRLHDLTGECDIVAMEEIEGKDGETVGELVVVPAGVFSVADPVSLANGRLMAAAAEMEEALQLALDDLWQCARDVAGCDVFDDDPTVIAIRSALAKSRGCAVEDVYPDYGGIKEGESPEYRPL